mmetsp:Transcript_6502/g.18301  ORF Transcript_6502/g.18301 Transcript_6502/m.18301 type:complete len:636 (-) Transcript_6502:85-1992(-)
MHQKIVDTTRRIQQRCDIRTQGDMSIPLTARRTKANDVKPVRTKTAKPKRRKKPKIMGTVKYGVYVPRNVSEALAEDKKNGNNLWRDSIVKEVSGLLSMNTFKKLTRGKETDDFVKNSQYAPLQTIFDMKQSGRRKCRVVVGGHVLDSTGYDLYASNMKTISARTLMLIAAANKMEVRTGDIKQAYLYAKNNMNIRIRAPKEFNLANPDIKPGDICQVVKAHYGTPSAAHQWHAHLANTLLSMEFKPSRFDPDVWIRKQKEVDLYEYIGTHTDDLLVVSMKPDEIMSELQREYTISGIGEPDFHLGCDYERDDQGNWYIGSKTYVGEALKRVKLILGKEALHMESVPMYEKYKPELEKSEFLDEDEHNDYQKLIGISQWLITCGRMDIAFAVSSLSRFSAAPRKGHMDRLIKLFGYLQRYPSRRLKIDPSEHRPPIDPETNKQVPLDVPSTVKDVDWKQQYPDAKEEIMVGMPEPLGAPLSTAVYFDSNFAHDETTRRSITGVVSFLGNTPVSWISKRQGAIATSTYGAELCAAKTGAEEVISLRFMLRSLGIPMANEKTLLIGDNLGSLQSVSRAGAALKKKPSAVHYHFVRECTAAGILDVRKIHTEFNPADPFTKALAKNKFLGHFTYLFCS